MPRCLFLLALAVALVGCGDPPRADDEKKDGKPPEAKPAKPETKPEKGTEDGKLKEGSKPEEKKEEPKKEEKTTPIPKEKWDLSHAEKDWNVKFKGVRFKPSDREKFIFDAKYEFLLEFTKDLDDDELKAMKAAWCPTMKAQELEVVFFDSESVVVSKSHFTVLGEMTGVKGDAFRVVVHPQFEALKAGKAAFRPIRATGTGKGKKR